VIYKRATLIFYWVNKEDFKVLSPLGDMSIANLSKDKYILHDLTVSIPRLHQSRDLVITLLHPKPLFCEFQTIYPALELGSDSNLLSFRSSDSLCASLTDRKGVDRKNPSFAYAQKELWIGRKLLYSLCRRLGVFDKR